jgi:YVTN family beta-propeller protein
MMNLPVKALRSLIIVLLCVHAVQGQNLQQLEQARVMLPNGWGITRVGESLPLGDLPLNMVLSPSTSLLAVTNNGQSDQSIYLIDPVRRKTLDTAVIGKAWVGLAFSSDEKSLFVSGGNDNWIIRYDLSGRHLVVRDTIPLGKPWPEKISPAGMACDNEHQRLYVVTKENNSLYIIDMAQKKVESRFDLGGEGYTCLLSPDNSILYVTCWGCDKVLLFNTRSKQWNGSILVGDNPNDMCLDKGGRFLFVANANDNSVSVIDLQTREVIETLNAALYPGAPSGSTTNSVALSGDGRTLYVANADNNCLAVFDVSNAGHSRSRGFIPTGWYPTCVRVSNGHIFVANGKGFSSLANPYGPNPARKKEKVNYRKGDKNRPEKVQYIAGLFRGTMSIIREPGDEELGIYSRVTYRNTPYSKDIELTAQGKPGNPVPTRVGDPSPIKHVFYVIKENRTYDQVLGDLPRGNGDTSLVLFGERITPNQHKLAGEFVLLDNFYVNGEVSADGHNWSMGAYATDYLEKTWPTSYGDRGGSYDAEGVRDIANCKNGFLWDMCKRYGVTYRTYGEFADDYKPNIPVLEGHYCRSYTSWDESVYDTTRFHQWKRDFDSLLARGEVPRLSTLRFINDHTEGLKVGRLTPFAHVADNDRAVGLFIEHLAKSSLWKESAIFILEDDAQNGPDHVDAHRSTAYVAGGFVKRGYVDHTMYSTSSMVRTMELILGLPPMSQYDAAATPMWRCFGDTTLPSSFKAVGPFVDVTQKNLALNEWQRKSEEFDFTKEDRAPDDEFNRVLWFAVKGGHVPYPSPRRSAFVNRPE